MTVTVPRGAEVSQEPDHHGRRRHHDEQPVGDRGDASDRRAIAGHGHDHDAHHDRGNERGRNAQTPPRDLGGVQREHQRGANKDGRDRPLDIARLSNALEDERGAEREEQHPVALPRALHPAVHSPSAVRSPALPAAHTDQRQPRPTPLSVLSVVLAFNVAVFGLANPASDHLDESRGAW